MPLYEFECPRHGRFEVKQAMLEEHKAVCPQCGLDSPYVFKPFTTMKSKELTHTDSGISQSVHDAFTNKNHELYDRNLARQGKKIDPEDM